LIKQYKLNQPPETGAKEITKMKALLNIHRSIVRAAEESTGWQYVGAYDVVDNEEYGSCVYLEPDYDLNDERTEIMVLSLDEDRGDIEIMRISEVKDHPNGEFVKTLLGYYRDKEKPAQLFFDALSYRYPYAAGKAREAIKNYLLDIEDRVHGFPPDPEWDEIAAELKK